jgi:glycerophosphoryl diester phosphodiesterase
MSAERRVLDIAHRGASLDAPENTLDAFALAVEQGADMIETDLHLTADRDVVLVHDPEVGDSEVGQLPLEEIRAALPGVVTLTEALDAVGEKIPFNLEIKRGNDEDYAGLERIALEEVKRRGLLEQTLFSSFYDSVLDRLRRLDPSARIGLLISRRAPISIQERADRIDAEAVHLERPVVTPTLVERLQAEGYRVHVFTVDDPDDQRQLIEWGVDGIFTNAPAALRTLLDQ